MADHLHGATNPVVDIEAVACRREAGIRAIEFHNEAGVWLALQSDARGRVEILDDDLTL